MVVWSINLLGFIQVHTITIQIFKEFYRHVVTQTWMFLVVIVSGTDLIYVQSDSWQAFVPGVGNPSSKIGTVCLLRFVVAFVLEYSRRMKADRESCRWSKTVTDGCRFFMTWHWHRRKLEYLLVTTMVWVMNWTIISWYQVIGSWNTYFPDDTNTNFSSGNHRLPRGHREWESLSGDDVQCNRSHDCSFRQHIVTPDLLHAQWQNMARQCSERRACWLTTELKLQCF